MPAEKCNVFLTGDDYELLQELKRMMEKKIGKVSQIQVVRASMISLMTEMKKEG